MRSHSIIIRRIQCGLSITLEETTYIRKWILQRQKEQDRFINGLILFFVAVAITGGIITWIQHL